MSKKETLEEFKQRFYEKFPNSDIEIIKVCNKINRNIIIKNKYGFCSIFRFNLLKGVIPSIHAAINKTEYFINQAKEVHKYRYDYNLVVWKGSHTKIKIICKEHGVFEQTPCKHLSKRGCSKCGANYNCKQNFINKSKNIYGDKYNYDLVNYIDSKTEIKIICPIHGQFISTPSKHLSKLGCKKCGFIRISKAQSINPSGWNKTNWFKKAQKSNCFDSFKVYIIECWNEEERFYKIGRSFTKISKRFESKIAMPYKFKVLQLFEFQELTQENTNKAFDLENELKRKNKENKYLPLFKFSGIKECYSKLN